MLKTRYFPSLHTTAANVLAEANAEFLRLRRQLLGAWLLICMVLASAMPSYAQLSIDISGEDLEPFFEWFNTMFGVILPIALIGAGLTAGAVFAFVVGNMLKKAFQSFSGGG